MHNFYSTVKCDLYYFPERFPVWNSVNTLHAAKSHILFAILQLHKLHNFENYFFMGIKIKQKNLQFPYS